MDLDEWLRFRVESTVEKIFYLGKSRVSPTQSRNTGLTDRGFDLTLEGFLSST